MAALRTSFVTRYFASDHSVAEPFNQWLAAFRTVSVLIPVTVNIPNIRIKHSSFPVLPINLFQKIAGYATGCFKASLNI